MKNLRTKRGSIAIFSMTLLSALLMWGCGDSANNTRTNATSRTPAAVKTPGIPANAPAGATPPNYAGSPNATVTVEEFADFQCPVCASTYPVMSEIKSAYGTRIQFIFRNFPLKIPAHDKSYDAAVAAEAAGMQGKFFEMMGELFTNQKEWTADPNYKQIWAGYAQKIGINVAKWQDDSAGLPAKLRVDEDLKRGDGIGVNSTPTIFVNDIPVPMSSMTVSGLKQLIDAELQKGGRPAATTSSSPDAGNANNAKPAAANTNAKANTK